MAYGLWHQKHMLEYSTEYNILYMFVLLYVHEMRVPLFNSEFSRLSTQMRIIHQQIPAI